MADLHVALIGARKLERCAAARASLRLRFPLIRCFTSTGKRDSSHRRGTMIDALIELVIRIWHADATVRNESVLGESPMERKSRRTVAWRCGGALAILIVAGGWWCWWAWKHGGRWGIRVLVAGFLMAATVAWAEEGGKGFAAARALGSLRAASDVPQLVDALAKGDRNARFYAAYALGEIKDAAARDALLGALRDPEWCVRDQAAWALREIRDPGIAVPLKAMLKEPGCDLPHLIWLLQQYGESEAIAPYLPKPAARKLPLAAHWSFDDRSTSVARDVSGRAGNGEIKGCEVVEGKVGAALRCGKGRFIELGRAPAPTVAKVPFTIMAWIKAEAPAGTGVIVARGGAACGYSLYLLKGVPKFGIRRTQASAAEVVVGQEPIGGEWTHVAGVVGEDRLELFINGKLVASAPGGGYLPGNGGQGMEIGCDVGNSAVEITDAFEGVIDEVKQFNLALSEAEIAAQCR